MESGKLEQIDLKPLLCFQVNPHMGTAVETIPFRLENRLEGVDFLKVTDSALAKMRMPPFLSAAILKQHFGSEPLVDFSCRNLNAIAIPGVLLGGWATGTHSVAAPTGDAVSVGELHWLCNCVRSWPGI